MGILFDISQFKWAESVQRRRIEEALEAKRQQEKYLTTLIFTTKITDTGNLVLLILPVTKFAIRSQPSFSAQNRPSPP
jgi:hypothetical protein